MTEAKLDYLGPSPILLTADGTKTPWWRKLPMGFLIVVALPTLIAMVYYLLIASPRYVSESRFIVRSPERVQAGGLGIMLQGVGLGGGQTDAYAVHEYITSRDGLADLQRRFDVAGIIGRPDADLFSRYPKPWEGRSDEGLYKGLQRFVTVGYDSTTGISTLRVEAFRAADAQALSSALLAGGENLVNQLNERAARNGISEAARAEAEARANLADVQQRLTSFRNRAGFIDPKLQASESSELIGGLLATLAQLRAEREQLQAEAPQSPQLAALSGRIAAYERQVTAERAKLTGGASSLAPSLGLYQNLILEQEMADKQLGAATAAVITARQEARRQALYLERIVNPNLPDKPTQPRRWLAILTIFTSAMLLYGVGWLVWAGVREHRQG
jgi:capsular polysaccharide transport system permease protein